MIDLRSDTVTQPTPEMLQTIVAAPLGDAVMDEDPTVKKFEKQTAKILGKEAALLMPSATMSNQIAVRVHSQRGDRFLCEAECHLYHYEQGAYASLSGLVAHRVFGDQGVLTVDQLADCLLPADQHYPQTSLLCLENTHNRWGGRVQPQQAMMDACRWAHDQGFNTYLDGARIWNAAVASGVPESTLCEPFDSVSVCFSKGLGAPMGAALAGSQEFIAKAYRARKLFGGAMRQSGIVAAAALHAMEHHRQRLAVDHERAKQLGEAATACQPFSIRAGRVDTNIVMIQIDPAWGDSSKLLGLLAKHQVQCFAMGKQVVRLVTHLGLHQNEIDQACEAIEKSATA